MKKKLIFSAALVLSLGLAACGSSDNKNETEQNKKDTASVEKASTNNNETNVYQDYIENVGPIMDGLSAFSAEWDELRQQSADGTLSDLDFGLKIVNELIPKNMKLTEQAESLDVDKELADINEMLIDMLNKQNSALSEVASAIDIGDFSKITAANEYFSEARKIEREYVRELEKHVEQ
ncbi:hypothetical protein [Lysinibacillus sp. Bpr_S20]|uniref:hypothetical protein n=1 Tax=Lysinibacillus sp. Bpr_S20 TaxID=2933964 RepID=UPI0020121D3B|nr:hypothetical protein [Lysinibacillus sp. Bpr_S20]MCL1701646.1 hypothetical protein [Lysinibacillus sp. Bpr_S20]